MSEIKRECVETPPLGVMPRWCWIELRIKELRGAIIRYLEAGKPAESVNPWLCEIFNLEQELKNERGCGVASVQETIQPKGDWCQESWDKLVGACDNTERRIVFVGNGNGYPIYFEVFKTIWKDAITAAKQHGLENV